MYIKNLNEYTLKACVKLKILTWKGTSAKVLAR